MVTILLPIIFLIGILILQVFSGDLLSASNKESLVNISIDGREVTTGELESEKETVELTLEAKKKVLLEIPYDESISIELLNNKKEKIDIEEYSSTEFDRKELIKELDELDDNEETPKKFSGFQVVNSEGNKKSLFFLLEKEHKQQLKVNRSTNDKTEVSVLNVEKPEVEQTLLIFKGLSKSSDQISKVNESTEKKNMEKASVKKANEANQSKKQTSGTKTTASSEIGEQVIEQSEAGQPIKDSNSEEETQKAKQEAPKEEAIDSKTETTNETTELPKIGSPESYDRILAVETVKTKSSLNELLKDEYKASDSLKKPQYLTNSSASKVKAKETKAETPIIIRDVKLEVRDGVNTDDPDNEPGHDDDDENGIVRSFDQVSYLVSFSIQSTSTLTKYTNIRYRVIGELGTAVSLENGIPKNNGEISNGEYFENGDGSQYSRGVMESIITDTGQVFVPIIMNVYGAKHGTELTPSFKLEIVDATNTETGKVETFNKVYDGEDFEPINNKKNGKIKVKVSARPSVNVKLVAGDIKGGSTVGSTNAKVSAYDVGVTTFLQSLPERTETGDYRGSTFPTGPITYTIKQKGRYQKKVRINGKDTIEEGDVAPSQTANMECVGIAPAINDRTQANWTKNAGVKEGDFKKPLRIPNGITEKIYTSQPSGDASKIGVYNSGDFSKTATTANGTPITNKNYVGVLNPYTYNMEGDRIQSATDKSFSSLELIYSFDKTKIESVGVAQGWFRYDMTLYVDNIKYDGYETNKTSSIKYPNAITPAGDYVMGPLFAKPNDENNLSPGDFINLELNYPNTDKSLGDARLNQGETIYLSNYNQAFAPACQESKAILMWDSDTFEYDDTKEILNNTLPDHRNNISVKYRYGVPKIKLDQTAPYTMNIDNYNYTEQNIYAWYNTVAEAKAKGKISAVETVAKIDKVVERWVANPRIPVKVIGNPGDKTPAEKPIALFETSQFNDKNGAVLLNSVTGGAGNFKTYKPTVYDSNGVATVNVKFPYWHATSAYIKKFNITTNTIVNKEVYNSSEDIDVTVTGVLSGSRSVKYDGELKTTLPKGISYKVGSSNYGEPIVTDNPDGTQMLRWKYEKKDLNAGNFIEIKFKATSDFTKLTFKNTGYTDNLTVKTVGEMWTTGNDKVKDVTKEELRSSTDTFIEHLIQQVVLSKSADKPSIEVGEVKESTDPVKVDNSITYNVKLVNQSIDPIKNARILDVLPYDGDSRGTKFNGNYTVEEVKIEEEDVNGKKVADTKAKITFTNTQISDTSKPNDISGWTAYTPGTTNITAVKNAKAFLVSHPEVAVGNTLELTIKIRPKNQLAGDVLVNRASMDSLLELPVDSQPVWTRVYGRDLTGYVWYDDNYDGLMDQNSNGKPTDPVKDIAVKLYRTSLEDGGYKKQLVKQSLTGEDFIDSSGNSKIKTGADGKYTFLNLPEGDYLAEFILGDIVVTKKVAIVTKKLVGSDPKLNSKADPDDFKTPEYTHPVLKDLPTLLTGTDKVHHITDVNAGLARLSRIKLFKYEEGTVIDANGDGKLSDAEIEALTTTALAGAEFQLYKGKSDNPKEADKIGTVQVTGKNGWLEFDVTLPPGDYTIVETKAPAGFELLKDPIHVNVPQYNYVAVVHVADKGQIDLPFTGGTKAMRIILIASATLFVIGMTGVFLHFRPIKVRGGK